jgi:acyl-CoA ligase (AMP-forming) (exosortase A-associated)
MMINLHDIVLSGAQQFSTRTALKFKSESITYLQLAELVQAAAATLQQQGLSRQERVAVYLPKQFETVTTLFASSICGGVFVPVNPALKPTQVQHILQDCNVRILVTSQDRFISLQTELALCPDLRTVLLVDVPAGYQQQSGHLHIAAFHQPTQMAAPRPRVALTDADMAAILYTSGSTGKPKGVVLSHRNMIVGAYSVSDYLHNTADDVLLALLPLSFDYGLSQLTTAFLRGASVVLLDFFLVQDVVKAIAQHQVTGLAAVPPLWAQLAKAKWPDGATSSVRYLTNSGGAMPEALLSQLEQIFPNAQPYLMYGLTEAFRSTYLPPEHLARKRGSMGKAIPNAEILVVREDGSLCGPNEPGELVHRGPLVSLGYWNSPEKTAERFKFDPVLPAGVQHRPLAVWSGDTVKYDDEGFLYFIGRRDEMIKTSGNRVSPTEVEEAVYALDRRIVDVAALGLPHPDLDQAIMVLVACQADVEIDSQAWLLQLKRTLPGFMLPKVLLQVDTMPKNANGKIDRKLLAGQYQDYFTGAAQ